MFGQFPLQGPQPSRLTGYLSQDMMKILITLFDQVHSISNYSKENTLSLHNQAVELFQAKLHSFSSKLNSNLNLIRFKFVLEEAVILTETFCFSAILIGLISLMLKNNFNVSRKVRKKKETENLVYLSSLVDQFNLILSGFEEKGKVLADLFKQYNFSHLLSAQVDYNLFSTEGQFLLIEQVSYV